MAVIAAAVIAGGLSAHAAGALITSKTPTVTIPYPKPFSPGADLKLWIYDYGTGKWKAVRFQNREETKGIKPVGNNNMDFELDFKALGYGDGKFGILVQIAARPEPASDAMALAILVDTVPPTIDAKIPNPANFYRGGDTVTIVLDIVERYHKDDGLKVEIESGTPGSGNWETLVPGHDPKVNSIDVRLPARSSNLNRLRLTVTDQVGHSVPAMTENFGIDADPPVMKILRVEPDTGDPASARVLVYWDKEEELNLREAQLYNTGDDGGTWLPGGPSREDPKTSEPFSFTAPREGRYGFRLIGKDAVGNVTPRPAPGTSPDPNSTIYIKPTIEVLGEYHVPAEDLYLRQTEKEIRVTYKIPLDLTEDFKTNKILYADLWVKFEGKTWQSIDNTTNIGAPLLYKGADGRIGIMVVLHKNGARFLLGENEIAERFVIDTKGPEIIIFEIQEETAGQKVFRPFTRQEIRWEVADDNLPLKPVELYYVFQDRTGFQKCAIGGDDPKSASGSFEWKIPDVPEFWLKIVASDEVINKGIKHVNRTSPPPLGRYYSTESDNPIVGPVTSRQLKVSIQTHPTARIRGGENPETIEIWHRPLGGKWVKQTYPGNLDPPYTMTFNRDGKYELAYSIIPRGGASAEPEKAHSVLLIDTKEPDLSFRSPLLVRSDGGFVGSERELPPEILWTCRDDNLGRKPITIEFSRNGGSTWVKLKDSAGETSLGNAGSYIWNGIPKEDLKTCLIRITANDLAGNVREIVTPGFRIDSQAPTAKFIGRESGAGESYRLNFIAKDLGGSGIREVRLYMNPPGEKKWVLLKTDVTWDTSRSGYGVFAFPLPKKIGDTGFYIDPRDAAGNKRPGGTPKTTATHLPDCSFYIEPLTLPYTFQSPFDGSKQVRGGGSYQVRWYRPEQHSNAEVSITFYGEGEPVRLYKGPNTGEERIDIPKIESRPGCKLRIVASGQGMQRKEVKDSRPFTVDSAPPFIKPRIVSKTAIPRITTNSQDVVIPYFATDSHSRVARIFIYVRPKGGAGTWRDVAKKEGFLFTDDQKVTVSFYQDSDIEIYLGAEDDVGNRLPRPKETDIHQLQLTIDTEAPQITEFIITGTKTEFKKGEPIPLRYEYWDKSGEFNQSETKVEYAPKNSDDWILISQAGKTKDEFNLTAPRDPGEYYIRITVTDLCNNNAEKSIRIGVISDVVKAEIDLPRELLIGGEDITVSYRASKMMIENPVAFQFRKSPTADWVEISDRLPEVGSFRWKVPKIDAEKAQIRISIRNRLGEIVYSPEQSFRIDKEPPEVIPDLRVQGKELVKKSGPVTIPVVPRKPIGPAHVKTIELWVSEDSGRSYRLFDQIDSINKSFVFDRVEENRYFIITRAIDEAGRSLTPIPGPYAPEHARITIDKTPPRLTDVRIGRGFREKYFVTWEPVPISWAYHDERSHPRPITIEYSPDAGRTWFLIATNVPDLGRFNWRPQVEGGKDLPAGDFYRIRIKAVDLALNESVQMSGIFSLIAKGPEATVYRPQPGVQWFSRSKTTLLPVRVTGGDKIPITHLVLFYRPLGEPKWQKYSRTFSAEASQIPFEMDAGTYELLLKAVTGTSRTMPGRTGVPPPRDVEQPQETITIDPDSPVIKIISGFARAVPEYRRGEVEDLRWNAQDEYLDTVHLELSDDGGASWSRILGNQNLFTESIVGVPLRHQTGRFYKLRIVARDKAGNKSYDVTSVFSIDGSPPVLEVYGKQKLTEPRSYRFKLRPIGDISDLDRIDLYVRRHGESWKLVQSYKTLNEPITYTAPNYGKYCVVAVGIDRLGNTEHAPLQNDPGELEFRETRWLKIAFRGFDKSNLEVFRGGQSFRVFWHCTESDLSPTPVSFQYKVSPTGQWIDMTGQQFANTGMAELVLPKIDEKRVWIRAHVIDTQDSTGWDELPDPIEISSTPPEPITTMTAKPQRTPEEERFIQPVVEKKKGKEGDEEETPEKRETPEETGQPEEDYVLRGNELMEKGFFDEARKKFMMAVQRRQKLGDAYYGLGRAHLRLHSESSAVIHYFERALERAPNFAPCLNDLGTVYFELGKFEKALTYFAKAARLNPAAIYSANLGKAHYHLRNYSDSDAALDGALRADPKYWEAYWYKALVRHRREDLHGERDMWNKVLELIDPDSEWGRKAQRLLKEVEDKIKKS
jgi:Tfp pilus assembly protein PilF